MRGKKELRVLDQARDYIVDEKPLHAIQLYRKLMRGRYYRREAHIELAELLKYLSLLKEAEKILLHFLIKNPDDSEVIYRLALINILSEKFSEAESYIQRALIIDPGNQIIINLWQHIQSNQ
jgi:tetratricopeptide (TPR) repeat protein